MCDIPERDNHETVIDPGTRLLRLLSERCSTCIFRAGNPMHLEPGKLQQMVQQALNDGTWIICHQTLSYGDHPDYGGAICRGFADAYGHLAMWIMVARQYNAIVEVPPPPPGP